MGVHAPEESRHLLTSEPLRTGQVVDVVPVGLVEQFEDGEHDHNVLARLPGEAVDVDVAFVARHMVEESSA